MRRVVRSPMATRLIAGIGLAGVLGGAGCHKGIALRPEDAKARAADIATLRWLDVAWVKAAETKQVDAWMDFYSDDAVVLPPNDVVAKDKNGIRKAVGDLLGLPGIAISWEPTRIEVAAAGDLAYLYGSYELSSNDAHGMPMTDYGKMVEIWKKQPNGGWKCIVDTWNSDLPVVPIPMAGDKP